MVLDITRLQPGITDHNGNKGKNVMCNTCIWYTLADGYTSIFNFMFRFTFFILNKFITIVVVIKI